MSEFNDLKTEELVIENQSIIQPKMNNLQRIIGIYTKPQEVLTDVDRSPRVLIPMILISILTSLITLISYDSLVEASRIQLITAYKAQGLKIPLDGFVSLSHNITNGTVLFLGVGTVLGIFISALIIHGISTFMNGEGSIKRMFSVSLYVAFIPLLGSAIAGVVGMVLSIDLLSFSPVVLLSMDQMNTPLYSILSAFEVFNIWKIVIMIMAVKTVETISTKKATFLILGITIIGLLIQIVPKLGN